MALQVHDLEQVLREANTESKAQELYSIWLESEGEQARRSSYVATRGLDEV